MSVNAQVNEFEVSITRPGAGLSTGSGTVGGARVIPMDEVSEQKGADLLRTIILKLLFVWLGCCCGARAAKGGVVWRLYCTRVFSLAWFASVSTTLPGGGGEGNSRARQS